MIPEHSGADTQDPSTSALVLVPTVDQRLRLVSVGSDCSVDSHTRDTLSAGWVETTEICHCGVGL